MEETVAIAAPPQRVWEALTDLACWERWSTVLVPTGAEPGACLAAGGDFSCCVRPLWFRVPFRARVLAAEPPRRLLWHAGAWGVRARHEFLLADDGKGGTLFTSRERLSGWIVALGGLLPLRRRLLRLKRTFMDELKRRAESAGG